MFRTALKILEEKWKSYRHRFVPWIALNLWKNERTLRQVPKLSQDKLVPDEEVTDSLLRFFRALFRNDLVNQGEILSQLPTSAQTHYQGQQDHGQETAENTGTDGPKRGFDLMFHNLGFCLERQPSTLPFGGTGVFVTKGLVPRGVTVAMYPGTVYQSYDPIFFQSIRNPFVFRCIDCVLIDGNDKGISKMVYRSCSGRDRLGPLMLSDTTWLTANPVNPLAVGQYVNNCTNERTANVCYQEYDVPDGFPVELRQYLPNVNYTHDSQRPLRCVVLVSLQNIHPGEELFSNYFTIVH